MEVARDGGVGGAGGRGGFVAVGGVGRGDLYGVTVVVLAHFLREVPLREAPLREAPLRIARCAFARGAFTCWQL